MANEALAKLNARLSGKSGTQARGVGQKTSGGEKDAGTVKTVENPGEAFGAQKPGPKKESQEKSEPGKRGWPKGKKRGPKTGRAGTTAAENKTVIEGVASTLLGVHFFAAKAFDAQEFELTEKEAEKIALAVQRVSDQYGRVIDPRTEAWVGLVGIMGACYVPKIMGYNLRKANEKKKANPENQPRPQMRASPSPARPQPQPQPQPATAPVVQTDEKPGPKKKKDEPGTVTPSEIFGNINFSPDDGPIQ